MGTEVIRVCLLFHEHGDNLVFEISRDNIWSSKPVFECKISEENFHPNQKMLTANFTEPNVFGIFLNLAQQLWSFLEEWLDEITVKRFRFVEGSHGCMKRTGNEVYEHFVDT
ncbi:hypothetical protein HNY73_010111 [Argiope bruennichi]|uniref:Uncharacterized protein n=1 Tax=Argiope bruennichi TaxID=94029 RepID=A0A8T0EZX8_ARGBR|nr:hypothetical protein HNY73_010111 [Argiope bruennichi]